MYESLEYYEIISSNIIHDRNKEYDMNEIQTLCYEFLANIYKDEFNYKEAVRLYQQLITNADPLNQVQYKDEMYRYMSFLEVDTAFPERL